MSVLVALPRQVYPAHRVAFDPAAGSAPGNALALAWLAQAAYEADRPEKLRDILGTWGYAAPVLLTDAVGGLARMTRTTAFVAADAQAICVAFAGTDPAKVANWRSDLDAWLGARRVHRGFELALAAVLDALVACLDALHAERDRPLFLTGHSLGGALAVIAADEFQRRGRHVAAVATFGMPRVGGADFARDYEASGLGARTLRLVYGNDLVATLPPSALGYRHVGRRWSCARGDGFAAVPPVAAPDDLPALSLAGNLRANLVGPRRSIVASPRGAAVDRALRLLLPEVLDHLPDSYWGALG